jgi:gliding motility-associated-like protein
MKNQSFSFRKIFLILFSLHFFLPNYCNAQSCSDTAKKIDYSAAGYRLTLEQHIISNGGIFLGGVTKDNSTNEIGTFVFKVSPDGSTAFSKKINPNSEGSRNSCNGLLPLKNGNILLALGLVASLGSGDTTFRLMMLDNGGNLIWAKEYSDKYYSQMAVKKVVETEDGNIILMLNYMNANPAYADVETKTALIKINNNGDIVWSNYFSIPDDRELEGLDLSICNQNIYMIGYTRDYTNFYLGYPQYEANTWAAKINETTGDLQDSKSFLNLRVQNVSSEIVWFPNIYANLVKTAENNFIFTNKFENGLHNLYGLEKIMLDTNLNLSKAIFYTFGGIGSGQRIISNAKGETITYAATFEGSYISKFNPFDQPIREIKIKFPPGNNFQGNSWKPIGLKDKYISVINTYSVAGDTHFQLNQIPDDAPLSDCYGTDSSFIKQEHYPVTEVLHPFLSAVRNITMQANDFTATISDFPLIATFNCVIKSSCDSLSVSGEDSICRLNKWYTFVAHKNPDCNKHVFRQIDSTAVQANEQVNDTTLNIQFKENWSGYLYASISSCTLLRDSMKIDVLGSPEIIDLGKDTSLCVGQQLILNAKKGFKSYVWQNGTFDSIFIVTQPGAYFVIAKDYCNNIYSDTINIKYNQPTAIHLGNDTSICNNTPLMLNAGNSFIDYSWNTGEKTQFIQVDSVGNYNVSATDNYGCVSADTIQILNVFPSPIVDLNKQNILCMHQTDTLYAGDGYTTYLWQDGETQSRIAVTRPALYKIIVSNSNNCHASDSVLILKVAPPPANFLPAGTEICSDDSIDITPKQQFNEYLWSTGSVKNTLKVNRPGKYWLKVTDENGCVGSDTIFIALKNCDVHFFVPNAFSPNNDGINDIFKPFIDGRISEYYFAVYNRYGQMVFSTSDPAVGWDGTIKGSPQDSGIFVWYSRYKIKNETLKNAKGSVMLIR